MLFHLVQLIIQMKSKFVSKKIKIILFTFKNFQLFFMISFDETPHSNIRRVTAQRLTESKQQVPHYYVKIYLF